MMKSVKTCEGYEPGTCHRPRVEGERYCFACRTLMIRQMHRDGYLEPRPKRGPNQPDTDEVAMFPIAFFHDEHGIMENVIEGMIDLADDCNE